MSLVSVALLCCQKKAIRYGSNLNLQSQQATFEAKALPRISDQGEKMPFSLRTASHYLGGTQQKEGESRSIQEE